MRPSIRRASCPDCEMRVSATRVFVILVIWSSLIAARAGAAVSISVEASPPIIPADGKSTGQILVTVLDQSGVPVGDDTEVRLTTSAGDITPAVYTTGGRAVGILTSSTCPQIATVNAIADGASGSAQVEFSSADIEQAAASVRTIRVEGGSLAYAVDRDTILGTNNVTIEYKGLTIRAMSAQVCQASGQIRAQSKVSVQKDDQTLTSDALALDTRADRISLLDFGDPAVARTFDVGKLTLIGTEDTQPDDQDFSPLINTESKTWIVSGRLILIPGDRILFYKASVYVGESRVFTMPYYSYSYERRESILQQVRYDSSDGMLVDFPFYYRVADSSTGSLKLRYADDGTESGGYYRPRKGVSMGLEQDYSTGDRSRGRVFVDSLWDSSLALEMAHHLEFGSALVGGRADISARYQPSSKYAKDIYNTTINVLGSLRNYNYTLSGYFGGSSIEQINYLDPETVDRIQQSSSSARAVFRPKAPIITGDLGRISPSLTLGYGRLWASSNRATSPGLYQSLGVGYRRSISDKGNTAISLDGATALTLNARGNTGASLRAGPTLRTSWMGGSASLSYTLNLQDGVTDSGLGLAKHQLGCNLSLYGSDRWSSHLFANYGLDSGRLNLYSALNYRAAKDWQLRTTYSLYRYAYELDSRSYSYTNTYLKVGIYHPLGLYEIGLAWSPNGQNYGLEKDKRLWLEIGGRGF